MRARETTIVGRSRLRPDHTPRNDVPTRRPSLTIFGMNDMTIKDDLPHLVDELDEDAARKTLMLLRNLRTPRVLGEESRP